MTIQAESRQAEVVFDSELTRQCKARNARGEPCGAAPVNGADYCYMHAPELARERAEARQRGGYNRRQIKSSKSAGPVQVRSPQDVMALIEQAINDVLALENSLARARTIGYLAGVTLKAQEVGEFEERLEAMEAACEENAGKGRGRW